jgi:hypothetical protein
MRTVPWSAGYCIQTAGSIALEKNFTAESEKKDDFDATDMVDCRCSSSADTVALREQIFSNSSSSVRRAWQIANCCVQTCETCTYIGRWEDGVVWS